MAYNASAKGRGAQKLKLVKEHLEQHVSTLEITTRENISNGMYNNWLKKYLEQGEVGLENKKKPGTPLSKYMISSLSIGKSSRCIISPPF